MMNILCKRFGVKSLIIAVLILLAIVFPPAVQAVATDSTFDLLWSRSTDGEVKSVDISPEGYVAVGSDDIYLFNFDGEELWRYLTNERGTMLDIAITPDGHYLKI
ncbi:MAG: DUF5711 family protein [Halobacteriota archaeon]